MSFDQIPDVLNPIFWLSTRPLTVSGNIGYVIIGIFVAVFVLGVILRVIGQKKFDKYERLAYMRAASMLTSMGLLGGFLYLLSNERVQFFGGRFWYPLWLMTLLVWTGFLIKYIKRDAPLMRQRASERKELRKYIPGKKKKSRR